LIAARNRKTLGIITERDLLKCVIIKVKDVKKTKVEEVMASSLEVVVPGTDLKKILRLMFQKKIKKLPVVDKGRLVGFTSLADIARRQPAIIELLKSFVAVQNIPKSMKKIFDCYIAQDSWVQTGKLGNSLTFKSALLY
jgi:predicted transcriptional regulator